MNAVMTWLRKNGFSIGLILGSACLVFLVSFRLSEAPRTWYDEGIFLEVSKQIAEGNGIKMRSAPDQLESATWFTTVGYPVLYPVAAVYALGGRELWVLRLPMAAYVLALAFLGLTYAYVSFGKRSALVGFLLLVTYAPLYGNGKNILGEIPGLAWMFLALYALARIQKGARHPHWYMAVGLGLGLFAACKPNYLIALPFLLVPLVAMRKQFARQGIILAAASIFVTVILYYLTGFGDTTALKEAYYGYIFSPGTQAVTGLSFIELLVKNTFRFVSEPTPAYVFVSMLVWTTAIVWRWRRHESVLGAEWVAWTLALIAITYFLRSPGFYRYLLPAHILALAHLPYAGIWLTERNSRHARSMKMLFMYALGAIIVLQLYLVGFNSWMARFYSGTRTAELSAFAKVEEAANHQVLFIQAVEASAFMRGTNYYQYFEVPLLARSFGASSVASLEAALPNTVLIGSEYHELWKSRLGGYMHAGLLDGGKYQLYRRSDP